LLCDNIILMSKETVQSEENVEEQTLFPLSSIDPVLNWFGILATWESIALTISSMSCVQDYSSYVVLAADMANAEKLIVEYLEEPDQFDHNDISILGHFAVDQTVLDQVHKELNSWGVDAFNVRTAGETIIIETNVYERETADFFMEVIKGVPEKNLANP